LGLIVDDGAFNRADAWSIVRGWGRGREAWRTGSPVIPDGLHRANRDSVLAATDFRWLYQAALRAENDGHQALASALGQVAALLFDPGDPESAELIYRHQDHPVWQYVSWSFEPVDLDSEQARLMREAHRHDRGAETTPWPEADEFAANLNDSLRDALAGETDAFWRLAWNLQADPSTGQGARRFDDALLDFPGIEALDGDPAGPLAEAAIRFVTDEHDHASEWLGTERYDKRGWAGYLALALLERLGRLHDVPDPAWASWVGALIWFPATYGDVSEQDRKKKLLARAAGQPGVGGAAGQHGGERLGAGDQPGPGWTIRRQLGWRGRVEWPHAAAERHLHGRVEIVCQFRSSSARHRE
jgi:hypothetical protein